MFSAQPDPIMEKIKAALEGIDANDLTPRQALDEIYNLQSILKKQ